MMDVDNGFAQHCAQRLACGHANGKAPRHAWTTRHSDTVQILVRYVCLLQSTRDCQRYMSVVTPCSLKRMYALCVGMVLFQHH